MSKQDDGSDHAGPQSDTGTVGEMLRFLLPGCDVFSPPSWPPDVFAVAAILLLQSGAYTRVVQDWPPKKMPGHPTYKRKDWVAMIRGVAASWRRQSLKDKTPKLVQEWWRVLLSFGDKSVVGLPNDSSAVEALLQLLAAADEASAGVGLIPRRGKIAGYQQRANDLLWESSNIGQSATLCEIVPVSRAHVLPKLHTPQNGLTLRSLSHHLALYQGGEVAPRWHVFPLIQEKRHRFNLLILPWPLTIKPANFQQVRGTLRNMPQEYGFFEFSGGLDKNWECKFKKAFIKAWNLVGEIDGVAFPELALADGDPEKIYETLASMGQPYADAAKHLYLIAGANTRRDGRPQNVATLVAPWHYKLEGDGGTTVYFRYEQAKHHRWRLDAAQITQYGLGGSLDPNRNWWEYSSLKRRELCFVPLREWLTACFLVCEDLARVDPVTEIIRAVGPNLVFALLMDGPQLAHRWPARYATVLADDPGSSVLTLTSLGMAKLSRPPGVTPSRSIAMWKDGLSGARPIEITLDDDNACGAVLTLTQEFRREWTADGREDTKRSSYIKLTGVHPI